MAAAAVVLISAGVAVAANPGLLRGRDDAPQVGEMTPSAEPTAGESSTAPTTPVGGSVDTGTDSGFREKPADEGTEDNVDVVPSSGTPSGDTTPSESSEPSTSPSDPAGESASATPTAEPTETATVEPTEDPVEEPTSTATP
jgi:eukaryotic-like serine/threonine-protein kinase